MHRKTHDEDQTERRGDLIITRGMRIVSYELGLSGKCDVIEFHKDKTGVELHGWEEKWSPFPVEYKRGEPKENNCDAAQLCAQALCLEDMLCCTISQGALFYGESRRRTQVTFDEVLRRQVIEASRQMHELFERGYTPKVKPTKSCNACSLKELCLPSLMRRQSVKDYLEAGK